jgi:hypothetical protein
MSAEAGPTRCACGIIAVLLMCLGTLWLSDSSSARVPVRVGALVEPVQRDHARARPPAAPPSRSSHGAVALVGGNTDVQVDVVLYPDHTIQYSIAGKVPCAGGGSSISGTFAHTEPGHWSGHSFSGSSGGSRSTTTTISGTFTSRYTMAGTFSVSATYTNLFATIKCGTTGQFTGDCGRGCPQLVADAGGAHEVVRAARITLDGSRSHATTGSIRSYRWTYRLGPGCPKGAHVARNAVSRQRRVQIVVLCSVDATLTVTGSSGEQASDDAKIDVMPRAGAAWQTPTIPQASEQVKDPGSSGFVSPDPKRELVAGLNRCPDGHPGGLAFCRRVNRPWSTAFRRSKVTDPGGPFQGWWYVSTSSVALKRVVFINPWITPDGPNAPGLKQNFYNFNLEQKVHIADYVNSIVQHEGYGDGTPLTGHIQAMQEAITSAPRFDDPRHFLETRVSPNGTRLRDNAVACLKKIDQAVYNYSTDDLNPVPGPSMIFMFSPTAKPQQWLKVYLLASHLTPRSLSVPECVNSQ